jgi:hypothetical protein
MDAFVRSRISIREPVRGAEGTKRSYPIHFRPPRFKGQVSRSARAVTWGGGGNTQFIGTASSSALTAVNT